MDAAAFSGYMKAILHVKDALLVMQLRFQEAVFTVKNRKVYAGYAISQTLK